MTTIEKLQVEYEAKTGRAERDAARFAATQETVAAKMRASGGAFTDAEGRLTGLNDEVRTGGKEAEGMERKTSRLRKAVSGLSGESRNLESAIGAIAFPGAVGGLGALAAGAQSAGGALVALGAATAPLAGLAATIPQLGGAAAQGFGVAKLATAGFGDALKALDSGDVDKIKEAFKNLSPEAARAARTIFSLKPVLDQVRRTAQQNVFGGVNAALRDLQVFIPNVRRQIASTSATIGGFIRSLAAMAAGRWRNDINTFLSTNSTLLKIASGAALNVADAFVNLTASAQPLALWLARLTAAGAESVAQWVAQARATGQLARFFEATKRAAASLGTIVYGVTGILIGLGRAAFGSGQQMLGTIGDVLAKWAQWVNSAKGQATLNRFFDESRRILGLLAGVVGTLAGGAIRAALALQSMAAQVADLNSRYPGMQRLAAAAAAVTGGFVLLNRLGVIAQLTGAFAALGRVAPFALGPVAVTLAAIGAAAVLAYQHFAPFRELVDRVAGVLARNLMPAFQSFVGFIRTNVVPVVKVALGDAMQSVMRALNGAVGAFRNNQAQFLAFGRVVLEVGKWLLVTALPAVIRFGGFMAGVFVVQITGAMNIIGFLIRAVQGIVGAVKAVAAFVPRAWGAVTNFFTTAITSVVGFFKALPGRVVSAIAALPGLLVAAGRTALSAFVTAVKFGVKALIAFVIGVPLLIIAAMIALPRLLDALANKAWSMFIAKSKALGLSFLAWAKTFPGQVWNATVALVIRLSTLAANAWTAFRTRSSQLWTAFIGWARTLPGAASNAISRLPSTLSTMASRAWSSFKTAAVNAWNGIYRWMTGIPGAAARAIGGFGSRIADVVRKGWHTAATWFDRFMNAIQKIASALGAGNLRLPHIAGDFGGGGPVDIRQAIAGGRGGFAEGGMVTPLHRARGGGVPLQRGTPGRDSVLARVTPGEYVLTPEMVQRMGGMGRLEAWRTQSNRSYRARRRIANASGPRAAMGMPGEAGGGRIARVSVPAAVGGDIAGLVPSFLAALRAYSTGIGRNLSVTSGFRTRAEQAALYAAKPGLAAPPGRSNHERGLAADLSPQLGGTALGNPAAGRYGLRYPMSYEPWHIEPSNLGGARRGGLLSFLDPSPLLRAAAKPILSLLGHLPGALGPIARGGGQKILDAAISKLSTVFGGPAGGAGAGVGGSAAANRALGRKMAAARGWTGQQWAALDALVMGESGWRNDAQNPTSTAYGIGQFLNSTWGSVGARKTSDPTAQIAAMLRYIAQRYGSPVSAYRFKQSHNWYESGGAVHMATGGALTKMPKSWSAFTVNHHLGRMPDDRRIAYVSKFGVPPAPRGWAWAEDGTLVRSSFYGRGHGPAARPRRGRYAPKARAAVRARPFAQLGNGPVRLGSVSTRTWNALRAAGWRGHPGDRMEALYRPGYAGGGPVAGGIPGYAAGALVGRIGSTGFTFGANTGNLTNEAAFLGHHRNSYVPGGFLASDYQRAIAPFTLRTQAAKVPATAIPRQWKWRPLINPDTFYTQDLRDPNRGKAGYIQTGYGYWMKATAGQLRSRENTYRVHLARRRRNPRQYSATGVKLYAAGGPVRGAVGGPVGGMSSGMARSSYAAGGTIGGTVPASYGGTASYMPSSMSTSSSSSVNRTVNMAPGTVSIALHGVGPDVGQVVSDRVSAALRDLVSALNARGG